MSRMSEEYPLLLTSTNGKSQSQNKWKTYHTIWSIMIRIVGDILCKNITVFYEDYRNALNMSIINFGFVIISQQFGSLVATILLPIITKLIPNSRDKISIFGFLCGLLSIAFVFIPLITDYKNVIIIWCCLCRLLFSVCFNMYTTSILDLASQTNEDNGKQGQTIGLLNISWTVASLSYVVIGCLIKFVNWWISFALFGVILCIFSIISHFVFSTFDINSKNISWIENMKSVLYSQRATLIFGSSFLMGIFTGSFGIILISIWLENIFGLDSFKVGMIALSIFIAELFASFTIAKVVDQHGIFKCVFGAFSTLISGLCTLSLLYYFLGAKIGGIVIAILIIFILYFGGQYHQLLCIQNAKTKDLISLTLMMNFVSTCIGNILGSYLAPFLWDNGNGISIITSIWMGCTILTAMLYFIIWIT